jgi:hypothetical protein
MRRKTMTAREMKSTLLARCSTVACEVAPSALNHREANFFRVAAMAVRSRFPHESRSLMQASNQYFAAHPDGRWAPAEVLRNGWILSLPRLRDMLSHQLSGH